MSIITNYNPAPMPDRRFDWTAVNTDTNEFGCGSTKEQAIDDLLNKVWKIKERLAERLDQQALNELEDWERDLERAGDL